MESTDLRPSKPYAPKPKTRRSKWRADKIRDDLRRYNDEKGRFEWNDQHDLDRHRPNKLPPDVKKIRQENDRITNTIRKEVKQPSTDYRAIEDLDAALIINQRIEWILRHAAIASMRPCNEEDVSASCSNVEYLHRWRRRTKIVSNSSYYQKMAQRYGVPTGCLASMRIEVESGHEEKIQIFYGGGIARNEPFGPGHGHIVIVNGELYYKRAPFTPHGVQNYMGYINRLA